MYINLSTKRQQKATHIKQSRVPNGSGIVSSGLEERRRSVVPLGLRRKDPEGHAKTRAVAMWGVSD